MHGGARLLARGVVVVETRGLEQLVWDGWQLPDIGTCDNRASNEEDEDNEQEEV